MKIKITGLSLLELRDKYGVGSKGFYDTSWWLEEDFAKEKPEAGEYEISFKPKLNNLNFGEQKAKLKKGFDFCHPAVLAETILSSNKRIKKYWYSGTSVLDSDGSRVDVGYFDSNGLDVNSYWDDNRYGFLGVASARLVQSLKIETFTPEEVRKLKKFSKLLK